MTNRSELGSMDNRTGHLGMKYAGFAREVHDGTTVAGPVSAQPGIALGEPRNRKGQIATSGRVRVEAMRAPIRSSLLFAMSESPATAMRSEAIEFGRRKFRQLGTIVKQALEPLESGAGRSSCCSQSSNNCLPEIDEEAS